MNLMDVLSVVRRRWLPLLVCLAAGVAGAVLVTHQSPRVYRASTTLIVNIPSANNSTEALQGVQLSSQLLKSYASIATSRTAAEQVKQRLSLPDSVTSIRESLSAEPQPETLLITVSATARSPGEAEQIANADADVLVRLVGQLERNKAAKVDPHVVDPAVAADAPVSPRPKLNLAVGMFVGLIVGLGLALLLDALDRSVKTPSQAAEIFKAPLLGVVPRAKAAALTPTAVAEDPTAPVGEAYRALRTAIRFINPDAPLKTILVTSAATAEGKTTTAANLAVALAQAGERVVLVDADLRRSRVADTMGLPSGVGVTSVLTHRVDVREALQGWRDELLAVLGSGDSPPNPSELLGSEGMAHLLAELRQFCDVVIIDAPPVLPVTDAVVLATQVDGVVMIARAGATRRNQATEAIRRLDAVNIRVVGCVLNGVSPSTSAGYYEDYRYLARRPTRTRFGRRATDVVS